MLLRLLLAKRDLTSYYCAKIVYKPRRDFVRVVGAFPGVVGLRLNHAFTIRPATDFYIGEPGSFIVNAVAVPGEKLPRAPLWRDKSSPPLICPATACARNFVYRLLNVVTTMPRFIFLRNYP